MTEASSLRDLDYVIPLIISFSHPFLFPSLASTPAAPPHQRAARVVLGVWRGVLFALGGGGYPWWWRGGQRADERHCGQARRPPLQHERVARLPGSSQRLQARGHIVHVCAHTRSGGRPGTITAASTSARQPLNSPLPSSRHPPTRAGVRAMPVVFSVPVCSRVLATGVQVL